VSDWPAAVATALWLGILTSISPCPLASNVAAISFLGRDLTGARRVLLAGLAYTAGRAATYVAVAAVIVGSLLSVPSVSLFLQGRFNQILGPVLLVLGAVLLGWLRLPSGGGGWSERLQQRAARAGVLGAGALGLLFALSFCPVSAGLFFGGLVPLAAAAGSPLLLPALFGAGTALPVVVFAVLLALGAQWVGRAFRVMTRVEKALRVATGIAFLAAGAYLTATHLLGLSF
jgi:cytochrome c-type biogenesis protein